MPPAQSTKQPPDNTPAPEEATPLAAKPVGIAKRKPKRIYAIPRVSFRRLVQEIADQYGSDLRIQQGAMDALQESAENLIAERFARCGELIELCKLDTVREEHWRFVQDAPC